MLVLAGVTTAVLASVGAGPLFAGGEVATLELDPAAGPIVYAALDGAGGYARCEPVGANAAALGVAATTTDWSVVAGGREWHAAFHLTPAAAAGTYQLRCTGTAIAFGVGDRAPATGPGAAHLPLLVLPLIGLAVAGTTTAVVLARRRAAQDRLVAPWTGGPAVRW